MSAKINLYNDLVTGSTTAVEPKEGYVYVVTKVTFKSETDSVGNVSAAVPGGDTLVSTTLQARHETGWEGTLAIEHGGWLIVAASPAASIRCIVEGYFLLDVPAFARTGAGAMDEQYGLEGAIQVKDSPLAQMTYLMLVELKRIRSILETSTSAGSDRELADAEIVRELES